MQITQANLLSCVWKCIAEQRNLSLFYPSSIEAIEAIEASRLKVSKDGIDFSVTAELSIVSFKQAQKDPCGKDHLRLTQDISGIIKFSVKVNSG